VRKGLLVRQEKGKGRTRSSYEIPAGARGYVDALLGWHAYQRQPEGAPPQRPTMPTAEEIAAAESTAAEAARHNKAEIRERLEQHGRADQHARHMAQAFTAALGREVRVEVQSAAEFIFRVRIGKVAAVLGLSGASAWLRLPPDSEPVPVNTEELETALREAMHGLRPGRQTEIPVGAVVAWTATYLLPGGRDRKVERTGPVVERKGSLLIVDLGQGKRWTVDNNEPSLRVISTP
jgi:hypothetical protein